MRLTRRAACLAALAAATACDSDDAPSRSTPTTQGAGAAGGAAGAGGGASSVGGAGGSYAAPYKAVAFDAVTIASHSDAPNYQRATAAVTLDGAPFASVQLVVDLATTCYPFDGWKNDPPPPGENWPADCDAFDRNFEIALDEPPPATSGPPGIELLHAITPFGGPLHLEVDVTDVANGMPGMHRVDVFIPTYSDAAGQVSGSNGRWTVSARFEVTPGPAPRHVLAVVPIYRGVQTTAAATPVDFTMPDGTVDARIEYRASGHGGAQGGAGCIGPAEEFCHRTIGLTLDGANVGMLDAWRTDCATLCTLAHYGPATGGFDYCQQNPCGAIASVKAPRANWCPGSVTPPLELTPAGLTTPGAHSFGWTLSSFVDGGSWRIAAHAVAIGR